MPSSSSVDPEPAAAAAEYFASTLRTQAEVDAICRMHGVDPALFTARPAGADLRASSPPPPNAVCVYADALEAGMRVPLHAFFSDALAHFSLAPTQLSPNGWRIMAGFVVVCRHAGVPPSLAVFRHFVTLCKKSSGWYFFRSKKSSGLRFAGTRCGGNIILDWKHRFFFLSSPAPWPCPVEWGVPSVSSFKDPVLTPEEKGCAAKLLLAHSGSAIDFRTYLCETNLAAAMVTAALLPMPSSARAAASFSSRGMDSSVYDTMEKAKTEPGLGGAWSSPLGLCGKKRSLQEANGEESMSLSVPNTPPASDGFSAPPDFSYRVYALELGERLVARCAEVAALRKKLGPELEKLKAEVSAARQLAGTELEKAKSELAAARAELSAAKQAAEAELEKVKAELAATKRAAGTELEKAKSELAADRAELSAAKQATEAELEKAKAELAETKRAAGTELEKTKAEMSAAKQAAEAELEKVKAELAATKRKAGAEAVRQFLGSAEHVRRRAQHALEGYERWQRGTSTARSGSTGASPPPAARLS